MSTLKVNSIQSFTPSEPVKLDDTVHFTVEISGGLVPNVNSTFDLGTMTKSWKNAHIHGLAHIHTASINLVSGNLIPTTIGGTTAPALGTMADPWGSLHVHGLGHTHTASINLVSSSLEPDSTGGTESTYNLGSVFKQWNNLHLHNTASIAQLTITSAPGHSATISSASISQITVTNLPTSDPGESGRLFTQSGSQLPFSGSNLGAMSASLFVLVSQG